MFLNFFLSFSSFPPFFGCGLLRYSPCGRFLDYLRFRILFLRKNFICGYKRKKIVFFFFLISELNFIILMYNIPEDPLFGKNIILILTLRRIKSNQIRMPLFLLLLLILGLKIIIKIENKVFACWILQLMKAMSML